MATPSGPKQMRERMISREGELSARGKRRALYPFKEARELLNTDPTVHQSQILPVLQKIAREPAMNLEPVVETVFGSRRDMIKTRRTMDVLRAWVAGDHMTIESMRDELRHGDPRRETLAALHEVMVSRRLPATRYSHFQQVFTSRANAIAKRLVDSGRSEEYSGHTVEKFLTENPDLLARSINAEIPRRHAAREALDLLRAYAQQSDSRMRKLRSRRIPPAGGGAAP
ncbi:hypothetical protein KJ765_03425 [Candidatus Micrarchaeota archaeon]|nr:hypothetical protein [Candidatus Micrarchaeota archaeon]